MLIGLGIFLPLFLFSLFYLNPTMGTTAIVTILISVFFSITCSVALIGFLFRVRLGNNEILFGAFKTSLRQGILSGFFVLSTLGLASIGLLTWWDMVLLALSLVLFEIYFKSSGETNI